MLPREAGEVKIRVGIISILNLNHKIIGCNAAAFCWMIDESQFAFISIQDRVGR